MSRHTVNSSFGTNYHCKIEFYIYYEYVIMGFPKAPMAIYLTASGCHFF